LIATKVNYTISFARLPNSYSISMNRSVFLDFLNESLSSSVFSLVRREKVIHSSLKAMQRMIVD
jgi:hypothetical protein